MGTQEMVGIAKRNGTRAWTVTIRQANSRSRKTWTGVRFGQTAEAATAGIQWDIRGRGVPAEVVSVEEVTA